MEDRLAESVSQQQSASARGDLKLTIDDGAIFAIGIVVCAVEPLVCVAALTRIGLADIGLVTRRRAAGGFGLCAFAVLRVLRRAMVMSERD